MNKKVQIGWNRWAKNHQDLLYSVGRSPDIEQAKTIAGDLIDKLELGPEDDLLDVGCGSGLILSILRKKCRSAIGADFSHEQLRLGRRVFPDLMCVSADVKQLCFEEGQFSRVLCYSVWQYVEDWRRSLDGLLRVVHHPGIILIGDLPSRQHRWRLYFHHARLLVLLPYTLFSQAHRQQPFWEKFTEISDSAPHWGWVNLSQMTKYLEGRGCRVEILKQPRGHRQWGGITDTYRFDMKVRVPVRINP
jgi:ubiquinone/menaquinone biosynthesis C-methylase UbiE